MKRKVSLMVLLLVLIVGGIIYAGTYQGPKMQFLDGIELTTEQRAEIEAIWNQTDPAHQQVLDKLVEFGAISPEHAGEMQDNWESHSGMFGFRKSHGSCHGQNHHSQGFGMVSVGRRMMNGRVQRSP